MVKPISRPYSQYSLNALELLGQFVREARLSKAPLGRAMQGHVAHAGRLLTLAQQPTAWGDPQA